MLRACMCMCVCIFFTRRIQWGNAITMVYPVHLRSQRSNFFVILEKLFSVYAINITVQVLHLVEERNKQNRSDRGRERDLRMNAQMHRTINCISLYTWICARPHVRVALFFFVNYSRLRFSFSRYTSWLCDCTVLNSDTWNRFEWSSKQPSSKSIRCRNRFQ